MTYTVHYERDSRSGWWVATVPKVEGCLTQGRSIRQARKRIREALSLFVDDAESAKLIDEVQLPSRASKLVHEQSQLRKQAENLQAKSQQTVAKTVTFLVKKLGLSVRDAADILGISHQRVQQLISG